jgi:diguanylate cyclase (GGDEF)-like protein
MFDVLTKLNPKELERLQLFKSVIPESIEGILDSCVIRRLKKEEVLFVPGQPNRYLYQLMSGRLRVHLESTGSDPVSFIEPGETVGEMSIIDNALTSAFVVADEDSRLLVLEEGLVWSLVEVSHAAAFNLLKILTQRLRHANDIIAEKMQIEDSYYQYGSIDVLTGMHNRHWLDLILPRQLTRSTVSGKPLSLILIDIDHFKLYGEKHGRLCGDMAINKIARTIMESLRPTELAVRYGGDEFLVLLPDVEVKVTRNVAERLRQKVMYADIAAPDGRKLPSLTVSLGIAQSEPGQLMEEFLGVVEAALGRAKKMGRDFVSE